MTIKELIDELSMFPGDTQVIVSAKGIETPATQVVWQGSEPPYVIIDDFPVSD